MTLKCKCPNCGYPHLPEYVREQVEELRKEENGIPSEN